MTPQAMLARTTALLGQMEKAKSSSVAVGLPKEEVGGKIYGNGISVLFVGIVHEYGFGPNPQRSFLREAFLINDDKIESIISSTFGEVIKGNMEVDEALELIGATATNISKGAFTTQGYGTWPDITDATKESKDSSQILIDKGILRSSITWQVR